MNWSRSLSSFAWVFPVGRGNAAFVRTGLNQGFILDMGGGDLLSPADFIEKRFVPHLDDYLGPNDKTASKIAQAVLSHPHSDHIAECERLKRDLHPSLLTCPNEQAPGEEVNWGRIKNIDGDEGVLRTYREIQSKRRPPLQTIRYAATRDIPNLEYGIYYVRPPICEKVHPTGDNEYGNATSILLFLRHGDHTILFPGDMTPEGMEHILDERPGAEKRYSILRAGAGRTYPEWHDRTCDQPGLRTVLGKYGLTVLVAPHHGLESCYSEELYDAIRGGRPNLVVLSERRKSRDGDGNTDARYQSEKGAVGLRVRVDGVVEERRSLSTKNGHHILVRFAGTGYPDVVADKDPDVLYAILNRA